MLNSNTWILLWWIALVTKKTSAISYHGKALYTENHSKTQATYTKYVNIGDTQQFSSKEIMLKFVDFSRNSVNKALNKMFYDIIVSMYSVAMRQYFCESVY